MRLRGNLSDAILSRLGEKRNARIAHHLPMTLEDLCTATQINALDSSLRGLSALQRKKCFLNTRVMRTLKAAAYVVGTLSASS